jgi:hypothetical protein
MLAPLYVLWYTVEFVFLIHVELPTFTSAAALFNEELISLEEETQKKFSVFPSICLHNSIFYDIFKFFFLINVHLPTFTSASAILNEKLISLNVARRDAKKSSTRSLRYACTSQCFMIFLSFSSLFMFNCQLSPQHLQY